MTKQGAFIPRNGLGEEERKTIVRGGVPCCQGGERGDRTARKGRESREVTIQKAALGAWGQKLYQARKRGEGRRKMRKRGKKPGKRREKRQQLRKRRGVAWVMQRMASEGEAR